MPQELGLDPRQRILEAAADIFAKRSCRAATVSSIAHSSGSDAITVYRYFPKKHEMYWGALEYKFRSSGSLENVVRAVQCARPPQEFLNRVAAKAIQGLDRDPSLARLLYFTVLASENEKKMLFKVYLRPLIQFLTSRIDAWVQSGKALHVSPYAVAIVEVGVILSCCNLHELFGAARIDLLSPQELANQCTDTCVGGLAPA